MLTLDQVDLSDLVDALDDHSYEHAWFFDPATGEVVLGGMEGWDDEAGDERDLLSIDAWPSHLGYRDMEDFIELVPDRRRRESLERSIEGRGAFRRFKDALSDDMRRDWFRFRDHRNLRRAVEWLIDNQLVPDESLEAYELDHPQPQLPELESSVDVDAIINAVATNLRGVYGGSLEEILVFGSYAGPDAVATESHPALLLILDDATPPLEHLEELSITLWRHTFDHGVLITAIPVPRSAFEHDDRPFFRRVRAEGRPIG